MSEFNGLIIIKKVNFMTVVKFLFFRVMKLHFLAKMCNLQPCKKCTFTLSHQFYPRQIPGKSGKSTSSRYLFKNLPSAGRQKILDISIKYWPKFFSTDTLWIHRPWGSVSSSVGQLFTRTLNFMLNEDLKLRLFWQ